MACPWVRPSAFEGRRRYRTPSGLVEGPTREVLRKNSSARPEPLPRSSGGPHHGASADRPLAGLARPQLGEPPMLRLPIPASAALALAVSLSSCLSGGSDAEPPVAASTKMESSDGAAAKSKDEKAAAEAK